ncbi:MAG: hypothetical protein MJZ76_09330 [Bacteroidales bacterium]|nr:hypothetical protein [Bacteroidales bacterium]
MNKENTKDAMSDNEIRILGGDHHPNVAKTEKKGFFFHRYWKPILLCLLLLFVVLAVILYFSKSANNSSQPSPTDVSEITSEKKIVESTINNAFIQVNDTVINDIPLQIIVPKGCKIGLHMGNFPQDTNILLFVQAADIRADKKIPAGAFVYNGEVISKGHSKYGFCAIIKEQVTIGRQLETTLFERAVEENGCFFRQYSLISNGQFIEIPPKGKAIRRALCLYHGELRIITTTDRESFHDFTQALIDLGIEEALALVGGDAILQYKNSENEIIKQGNPLAKQIKTNNYLIWKK